MHHAAVAARESKQWHQVPWQRAAHEMGLKTEQIRGPRRPAQVLRRQWARLPGTMRGNNAPRLQYAGLPGGLVHDDAIVASIVLDELGERERLPYRGPRDRSALKQQSIEVFAAHRPAPGALGQGRR